MNRKVLVVEDQREISSIIIKYLENEGYDYQLAEDGLSALDTFSDDFFHLVLLDVMIPGIDGFQVLSEIRKVSNVPVIMLTARELEPDRIKGFDLGADDYVIKPFSPKELMRRIKSLFKRVYNENSSQIIELGDLKLNMGSMTLEKRGQTVELTSVEFRLLKVLVENRGIVLSREQIINLAFGIDYEGIDRNIDSYIRRLRAKLEDDPGKPKYLVTKYGAGYVFGGDQQ
ncbi:response regulator transcription factor [Gudongella oleilytica]|jgi:DNA-binding response OmpR family regulator|uniref:response regulator transcription factor n=1 Tax=Gudongella oleilytica TaxID=1582259 RepID=UPI000FF8A582|nr:response regulator transcription factor [Gudongella oleilytica]MDY0257159.1 response regulator transcription factor [Gudongella oleilytica]HMM69588.1 response regulator transcription factor [Gudongella oleilytica]